MSAPILLLPRPDWIKARAPVGERYERLRDLMRGLDLHTVCEEARRRVRPTREKRAASPMPWRAWDYVMP